MTEVRVELYARCHGLGKALIVGGNRRHVDRLPGRRLDILAEASMQLGTAWTMDDLETALLTIDAQLQLVQVPGRPAAGMDDAERAIGEID
ncbi:hypothetical protein D3C87_1976060 [compost metagenome]